MATEAQLIEALRRADAAGNAEDAQAIAGMIKAGRAQQPAQEAPRTAEPQGYIPAEPGWKDYARTAFDQTLQGGTFGLADEITDLIGAVIAAFDSDKPYGQAFKDTLHEARRTTKNRQEEQFREMPVTAIASQLGGGLVTGKAFGNTAAGQKFVKGTGKLAEKLVGWAGTGADKLAGATVAGKSLPKTQAAMAHLLRKATPGRNVAQDILSAAPAAAAYSYGTGESPGEVARNTALGVGAAGIASRLNQSLGAVKQKVPNSDDLKKQANALYQKAAQKGGTLKAQLSDDFLDQIDKLKPQTALGRDLTGDDAFSVLSQKLQVMRGKEIGLDAAQEIDEFLGDAIDSHMDMGRLTKQGKKILDVQNAFRDMIEQADDTMVVGGKEGFEALKAGRKMWSQSRKLADVERIIARAENMEQPATSIKSGFNTLLNNPKRMRGYTPEERELIKKAAKTGMFQDVLRMFGSRLVPIGAGVSGGGLGGTAAATAISAGSRNAGARMQVNKAAKLAEAVANGGVKPQPKLPPSLIELLMAK